jgi:hypothetical protein
VVRFPVEVPNQDRLRIPLFPWVKPLGREAGNLSLSGAEVRSALSCTYTGTWNFMKDRDSFMRCLYWPTDDTQSGFSVMSERHTACFVLLVLTSRVGRCSAHTETRLVVQQALSFHCD